MNQVFADTSFWITLRDRGQPHHERARELLAQLLRQRTVLVITLLVFAETQAYFCRSARMRNQIIADFTANPVVMQEPISFADQTDAIRLLQQHTDKTYSLCDAISFVVMRRLGLQQALAYDAHFAQFGPFEILT